MKSVKTTLYVVLFLGLSEMCCNKGSSNFIRATSDTERDTLGNIVADPAIGKPLPPWQSGELDIHFINSGRGECAFLILPDSTTMLIDAGSVNSTTSANLPPLKPDKETSAGILYGNYILKLLSHFPESMKKIDFGILTHFHYDHMGGITERNKWALSSAYQLGGITEIPEYIPIKRIIDRGWPDYDWPVDMLNLEGDDNLMMKNYVDFLSWQRSNKGVIVEKIEPGKNNQIKLLNRPDSYPDFEIRNICGNGYLWTGIGDEVKYQIPESKDVSNYNGTLENKLSIGFKITYGQFNYFTAGDMNYRGYERSDLSTKWRDFESPLALAVGPVEVMKANHHANYDANLPEFLGILKPKSILISSVLVSQQPDPGVLEGIFSTKYYSEQRDVFITNLRARSELSPYIERIAGKNGHIVVRVEKGGSTYNIYILRDTDMTQTVESIFGPLSSH